MRTKVHTFLEQVGSKLRIPVHEAPILDKLDRKQGFVSYNILKITYPNFHSRLSKFEGDALHEVIYTPVTTTVSITSVAETRDLSESLANRFHFYIGSQTGLILAKEVETGISFTEDVTRRTPQEGSFFEYQYGFDLIFQYNEKVEITEAIDYVSEIKLS